MNAPEEWYAKPGSGGHGLVISAKDGRTVAVAYDDKDTPILAAGPELLGLLEDAAFQLERLSGHNLEVYSRTFAALARAAIAKARGQA